MVVLRMIRQLICDMRSRIFDCLTMIERSKIKPIILLIVAYRHMRRSDSGYEAIGIMYSAAKQILPMRVELSCQHQAVWKLGSGNKVNICELLINIVNLEKLKMLISFNQKVYRQDVML